MDTVYRKVPGIYLRLMRASDVPVVKELHRELFQFGFASDEAALLEAVTSPRWLSLAAIVPSSAGDQLAGFLISVAGSGQDFSAAEYYGVSGSVDLADMEPDISSSESVAAVQGMPLLQLSPDDRAVNICLLATLPAYRRQGVATLLLEQATSSARAIRATQVFLHVMDTNSAALGFYAARGFLLVARLQSYYQQQKLQQELQERQLISEASTGTADTQTIGQTTVATAGVDVSLSSTSTLTAEREMNGNSPQAINNARSQFQPLQDSGVTFPKGDALLLTLTLQPPAPPVVESKAGMSDLATAAKSFVDWLTRAGDPSNASQNLSLIPVSAAEHCTHRNLMRSHTTARQNSLQQQTLACMPNRDSSMPPPPHSQTRASTTHLTDNKSSNAVLVTRIPSARTSSSRECPQDSEETLTAATSTASSWAILHSTSLLPACILLLRIVSLTLHTLVALTAGHWQSAQATIRLQVPGVGQHPAGLNSISETLTRSSHATCEIPSAKISRSASLQVTHSRRAASTVLCCRSSAYQLPATSRVGPGQVHVRQGLISRVSWC